MKCRFLQQCAVFFVYTFAHFLSCVYQDGFMPFFFLYNFYKKYFFCFLSYSPQCQKNSFRISGVHGILLSQIIPLQYTTLVTECQVEFVLILFYYFSQHFITIFCATSHRYIFCAFYTTIYKGRNSLRKCNLDVQNPCLTRHSAVIFLTHFYTQNINLSNYIISHILLLVKLALCKLFSYIFHNKTFCTSSFFSQTFLCVPFTSCLFKKITHHPPRAACLLHEHICLSRTSFYILCECAE